MNTKYLMMSLALGSALALTSGCSKNDDNGTKPMTDSKTTMEKTSNAVSTAADKVGAAAKDAKDKVVEAKDKAVAATENAVNSAKSTTVPAAPADASAQTLIDKAKSYVADKQYQPALDTLKQLSSFKLTDDQQKAVDALKAQIQQLIPANGAAGLLGK